MNVNTLNGKILDYRDTQWTQLLFSIGVIHNVLYTIFMHPPTTCTFKPFSACSNVITVLAKASTDSSMSMLSSRRGVLAFGFVVRDVD